MTKTNKAVFWSLFAVGGTVSAFFLPALALVTLMVAYGHIPDGMGFEQMQAFAGHWIAKLLLFGVISLSLWHTGHRLRTVMHGLGLRADGLVATFGYGVAALATVASVVFLLRI